MWQATQKCKNKENLEAIKDSYLTYMTKRCKKKIKEKKLYH